MSEISRHGKGDVIAGQAVGGRFATMERTGADGSALATTPSVESIQMSAFELLEGDVIIVDSQIAETELLPLGSELAVVSNTSSGGDRTIQTETPSGCGVFLTPDIDRQFQVQDPYEDIRRPSWNVNRVAYSDDNPLDWNGHELGLEDIGVIAVSVQGDHAHGAGYITATVREDPASGGCLTAAQFNRGWQHLEKGLEEEYNADVLLAENDDGEASMALSINFHARLGSESTVSDDMVTDIIWEKTEAVRFRNETDRGTYGSPFIYSRIGDEIDDGFFPGVGDNGQLDFAVRDSAKETAAEVLRGLDTDNHEQLHMLATRGYCTDADQALTELHFARADASDSQGTRELKRTLNLELEQQRVRRDAEEYSS